MIVVCDLAPFGGVTEVGSGDPPERIARPDRVVYNALDHIPRRSLLQVNTAGEELDELKQTLAAHDVKFKEMGVLPGGTNRVCRRPREDRRAIRRSG
jgi:hypothetical protein